MKNSSSCPKCEAKVFYRIEDVKFPNPEYANLFSPFGLTGFRGPTGEQGMFGEKRARLIVEVEAWVCKGCGFTEFYVKDLELLERCVSEGDGVSIVDRSTDAGPFR